MDSLRYWVLEMHVDGFRFDLASALARELYEVNKLGAFFDVIHQDPVLSQVKLIAEPWDLGAGRLPGRQLPGAVDGVERPVPRQRAPLLARRRRPGVRARHAALPAAATSTSTSGRRPYASINFVTAHDGFTLHDLVSYNDKHNEANGEDNRDGDDDNLSWNCGVEGPTDDPAILALRERQKRNFLATLLLSQGVPMICAGDELGRTQRGNNNAYCQDNEISWIDWEPRRREERPARLRPLRDRACAASIRCSAGAFLPGPAHPRRRREGPDVVRAQRPGDDGRGLGRGLRARSHGAPAGEGIDETDDDGEPISGDTSLVLLNGADHSVAFTLPAQQPETQWERVLDTGDLQWSRSVIARRDRYRLGARSVAVFRPHLVDRPAQARRSGER